MKVISITVMCAGNFLVAEGGRNFFARQPDETDNTADGDSRRSAAVGTRAHDCLARGDAIEDILDAVNRFVLASMWYLRV